MPMHGSELEPPSASTRDPRDSHSLDEFLRSPRGRGTRRLNKR